MCLAALGTVMEVDEVGATVDMDGRRQRVSTLLRPDVAVGDAVFVAGRAIVERLEPAEAEEVRAAIREAAAILSAGGST